MQLCVLGSGSSGNCTYIATRTTRILVDLGFGERSLQRRLSQASVSAEKIDGILLTHGHSDHMSGVFSFAGRWKIPVWMNEGTRDEALELQGVEPWHSFQTGTPFSIGDVTIEAFMVSHDAAQPVGFRFLSEGIRGALVTDLGELSPPVLNSLSGCDWLILESNHDEGLVKVGPYPWILKQRLLGQRGHLSNQMVGTFLSQEFDGSARHIFLAHLSGQNNHPEIALESALRALSRRYWPHHHKPRLHLTHQHKPSVVLDF